MELSETRRTCGGLRGLLDTLWRIHTRDALAVLGVVIATDGSTYQKPGALVLLDASGVRHGGISGGCLEPALEDAAKDVYASGRAAAVDFDTRADDDLLFGSGIGCRGRVHLLLLPLLPQGPLARALFAALEQGVSLDLALATGGADTGAGVVTLALESGVPQAVLCWDSTGHARGDSVATDVTVRVDPPPRVLLLGAGPETPPLAAVAQRMGWFVSAVEQRGRWAAFAQTASIDRLFDLAPAAVAAALGDEHADAIIVMSHNYAIDLAHLRCCADSDAGYIGLLGPAARRDALLGELDAATAQRLRARLHAPVGLDLGGHGAEAIALAIAAELQQYFSARTPVAASSAA
ncbi:MAG: XdhC family protein [Rudaea sp.]